jgi:hypothetical protein
MLFFVIFYEQLIGTLSWDYVSISWVLLYTAISFENEEGVFPTGSYNLIVVTG